MSNKSVFRLRAVRFPSFLLAFAATVFVASAVQAQPAAKADEPLAIKLTQSKVISDKQRETLADASNVKPGDVVEYRAVYTNTTKQPITRLVATLPLAKGLEYIPQTARPTQPAPMAATEDGVFGPLPLMRKVPGSAQPVLVPYLEYRSLRWNVGQLNGGASFEVVARLRVPTDAAPLNVSLAPHAGYLQGGAKTLAVAKP